MNRMSWRPAGRDREDSTVSKLTELAAERLNADNSLNRNVRDAVRDALNAVDGQDAADTGNSETMDAGAGEAHGVYLNRITVQSFRGIGAEATLDIPAGPGLTWLPRNSSWLGARFCGLTWAYV
jgi:hypothetical protein